LAVLVVAISTVATACGTSSQVPVPAAVPEARWLGISFYDPGAQKVFIFGGQSLSLPARQLSDMWSWDGKSWTPVPLPAGAVMPTERARGLSAYDPDHQRILLLGGIAGHKAFDFLREVWSWAGGRWTRLPDAPTSASIDGGAMAYDSSRHQLVVVNMPPTFRWGVDDARGISLETWLNDDSGWHLASPAHKLPFAPESMVFDRTGNRILVARLAAGGTEIWSWDGRDWSLAAEQVPAASRVLVDGGDLGVLALESGDPLAFAGEPRRVFRLQGGHWVLAGPPTIGPGTVLSAVYDTPRHEIVTFSDIWQSTSRSTQLTSDDTWTWTLAAGWRKHPGRPPRDVNATPSASQASPTATPVTSTPSPATSTTPFALAPCVMPFPPRTAPTPTAVAASLPDRLVFTEVGSLGSKIVSATRGPDGAVWAISEIPGPHIGSAVLRFSVFEGGCQVLARPNDLLNSITAGPDGNLWLTDVRYQAALIDRLTLQGTVTEYRPGAEAFKLAAGPDGAVWFTEESADRIGRITSSGTVTEYSLPATSLRMGCGGKCPDSITPGPDGALWFTEVQLSDPGNRIGRITLGGEIREFPPLPTPQTYPSGIAANGDSVWFGENRPYIGRMTVAGTLTEYPLPSASVGWATVEVSGNGLTWFETGKQTDTGGITQLGAIALDGSYRLYPLPDPSTGVFVLVLPNGFIDVVGMNGKVWQAHGA
jgi:virginiamycin B lyase